MVWESGCVVIVMLTPLSENGVKQCHHYWPDEGSDVYHIYEVRRAAIEAQVFSGAFVISLNKRDDTSLLVPSFNLLHKSIKNANTSKIRMNCNSVHHF